MPDYTSIEQFTETQLGYLQNAVGLGAMIIDWSDIDFDAGRGVLKGHDRCIWNKDGRRITVAIGSGTLVASQTKESDPDYPGNGL